MAKYSLEYLGGDKRRYYYANYAFPHLVSLLSGDGWNFGEKKSFVDSVFNKYTDAGLTGAQEAQNQWSHDEAQLQRDYEERMANSTYQRTVNDLQAAGLNPALAYGNAVDPTPSGATASSSSVGSGTGLLDLILQMKSLKIQDKLANADVRLKDSQTKRNDVETSWIDILNELKVTSTEIQNNLTEQQTKNLIQQRDLVCKQIEKIVQEMKESDSRILLNKANEWLAKASAKEILTMLPYNIALTEAKSEAEQAAAFLDWAYQAREIKLLSSDYYDSLIRDAGFKADAAQIAAESNAYDYVVHTGSSLSKAGSKVFHALQNLGEATSGLGAIFGLAAGVAGSKLARQARPTTDPSSSPYNYTIDY